MRKPLVTQQKKFNPDSIESQRQLVIDAFDEYLEASPYRFGRSKHQVMGPVGKILDRARAGQWDMEALAGYALRVHEMNRRAGGFISDVARDAMETGIRELIKLIKLIPPIFLAREMEKLEYGLYYRRRKRASQWMEGIRREFEQFLKARYKTIEALKDSWGDKKVAFGVYPSRNNKAYVAGKGNRKTDIDEFWSAHSDNDMEVDE